MNFDAVAWRKSNMSREIVEVAERTPQLIDRLLDDDGEGPA